MYTFQDKFFRFFKQASVFVALKCKTRGRKVGLSKKRLNFFTEKESTVSILKLLQCKALKFLNNDNRVGQLKNFQLFQIRLELKL